MNLDKDDPLTPSTDTTCTISLEELVNQCCLQSINENNVNCNNFKKLITKYHCIENLQFLIEIFKYEFIWNKLFKRRSSILKCHKVPSSQCKLIHNEYKSHENSINHNQINFNELINLKDNEDISTFVNLQLNNQLNSTAKCQDSWNDFDHYLDETPLEIDTHMDESYLRDEYKDTDDAIKVKQDLIKQWKFIINNFIVSESPSKINLPYDIYQNIVKEDNDTSILYHSPEILLQSKNFILQLLRENIYEKYCNLYQDENVSTSEISETNNKSHSDISSISNKSHLQLHLSNSIDSIKPNEKKSKNWVKKLIKH